MNNAEAAASSLQLNNKQEMRRPTGLWRDVFYRLRRHRIGMIGVFIVGAL
ncbi:MAG: hypothetical protein KDE50_13660, partial [Caldilineaceae bacterium]|nr:hypothetical protein [Caldilineaceae bacterium]